MSNESRQPNDERWTYEALALARDEDLEWVMRRGTCPDPAKLSGWEFRGFNTPEILNLAGIRKFKKGFYREDPARPHDRGIQGYNVQIVCNTLGEPWIDKLRGGNPIKHGWYEVRKVDTGRPDHRYPNGLLIDYGASPKNPALDPTRALRDYLVQVYPDNPDLYLGKAFIALGPIRVPISFFILERHNRSDLSA
jgi:hypothetical protein